MLLSVTVPQPPSPPYDLPLNTTMQTVATLVLWGGTALLLAYAVKIARDERSILPVVLVLAAATGSLIEPMYDIAYHLHWLDNGEQWTLFTSFGLPQPVWVMPAYVMVFGLPALVLYRSLSRGATRARIFKIAALTTCTTAAFEITAINLDLYVYYGESPWRVLDYPLFIASWRALRSPDTRCWQPCCRSRPRARCTAWPCSRSSRATSPSTCSERASRP